MYTPSVFIFAALATAAVRPFGRYILRSLDGRSRLARLAAPIEKCLYRLAGIDPAREQRWTEYAVALLCFHVVGIVALYALQRLQNLLPFNPQGLGAAAPDLALNTAVSFATNTSWQSYAGETTLGYLTQMAGITAKSTIGRRWGSVTCRNRRAAPAPSSDAAS